MRGLLILLCVWFYSTLLASAGLEPLRISEDRRYFVNAAGDSFFYLADTGWTMATRLTPDELALYLADRQAKGFTVIQLVLVPWDARGAGNLSGVKPYLDDDMARPNPLYFDHIERLLDQVEAHGMYAAVVPFWLAGLPEPGKDEVEKHEAYARYLGARFGDRPLFWLLGADRAPGGWAEVIRAFAAALEQASGRSDLLITHHPQGGQSSSSWFHEEPWLDFNMVQSGHNLDLNHFVLICRDYAKEPVKPVLDGEPAYEHITSGLVPYEQGVRLVTACDVRRQAYQSVFSGAAGHAYGACEVYEFHRAGMGKARWTVGMDWQEALQLPGARQVGYLAALIQSRSPLTRLPDPQLIASDNPCDINHHLVAIRDQKGRYAYIYTPTGAPFSVNLARLGRKALVAQWMDPSSGRYSRVKPVEMKAISRFTPPKRAGGDQDWVLVLFDPKATF
jgi:hypothetical protein